MKIEAATSNYLSSKTRIPLPEIFAYDVEADNPVGAPYIMMSYIHGTVALLLNAIRGCPPDTFGTPDQNHRFIKQMASIQVQLSSLNFGRIGSLRQGRGQNQFWIGSEVETGQGPWNTAEQYYSALVRHKLSVAEKDAEPKVLQSKSFSLPQMFEKLIPKYKTSQKRNYSLVSRDFGAHNVLVHNDFNIVGLIDLDEVMAATAEMVAQLPFDMGLDRPIPGCNPAEELAPRQLERLDRYVNAVKRAVTEQETGKVMSGIVNLLTSDAASLVQGLNAYNQHQVVMNGSWMAGYDLLEQEVDGCWLTESTFHEGAP